jgi:hypothetical protein
MFNKSISYFIINLWTLCDNVSSNSIESIDSKKSLNQLD